MSQCILVIDDDVHIRESLHFALEIEGYEILLAANGQEGLDFLQKITPDIILLDLMMPVVNGWQFIELLGQHKTLPRIPIIVLSAFTQKAIPETDAFITKPFELTHLFQVIQNLLIKNEKAG